MMKRLSGKFGRVLILAPVLLAVAGCGVFGGGSKKPKTPVLGQRVAILTSEAAAEPDPALADVSVLLPPAQPNDSWAQPGGNGAKSMEHLALPQALGKVWSVSISGTSKKVRLASPPVVAAGRIYGGPYSRF